MCDTGALVRISAPAARAHAAWNAPSVRRVTVRMIARTGSSGTSPSRGNDACARWRTPTSCGSCSASSSRTALRDSPPAHVFGPISAFFSRTSTSRPRSASTCAARSPAGPAPTMTCSMVSMRDHGEKGDRSQLSTERRHVPYRVPSVVTRCPTRNFLHVRPGLVADRRRTPAGQFTTRYPLAAPSRPFAPVRARHTTTGMASMLTRSRRVSVAILIALAGCTRADGGRDAQENRIVVVSKQINEFMYEIGAQHDIVAKDLTSIYPREIMKLPSVGYHRALSAEGIISMKPTLFLTDGNLGPDAVLTQLRKVGIPIVVMEPGSTVDSAQQLMTELGKRFHREQTADSVVAKWKQDMQQVLQDTLEWVGKKRPRVLIIHFGQISNDYLALKRGGTADRILTWAGGENAIDSVGGMARLTPELIAKAQPDIIIATDVGFDRYGSAAKFATMPGVSLTPAGKDGRIYKIYEQQIMYFGPRTPAAIREIEGMLHPEMSATRASTQPAAAPSAPSSKP